MDTLLKPLWAPTPQRQAQTHMKHFIDFAANKTGLALKDSDALYEWSCAAPGDFWNALWDYTGVIGDKGDGPALGHKSAMYQTSFFPDARLNITENFLRHRGGDSTAVTFYSEDKVKRSLSHDDTSHQMWALSHYLKQQGVVCKDRVAGYLPNMPEALLGFMASANVGAIWSSCSPDFGVAGVADRFGQINPKVLIVADHYFYNGKSFSCLERIPDLIDALPSLEAIIVAPLSGALEGDLPKMRIPIITWQDMVASYPKGAPQVFERYPFNNPLAILYSSGTTGAPKCIVHRAGGVLLEHMKEHQLHCDIQPGDVMFYYTTCGWMMWNWMVSALASGASLVLYDGSPFYPKQDILFDLVDQEGITFFGTSAKYIDALAKNNLSPRTTHNLSSLKTIASTGSPLLPESFAYVYKSIKRDVHLASISGGTDIVGCFFLGDPTKPVYSGELQMRSLGLDIQVFNESGEPTANEKGELVCTAPFPTMPLMFWNDKGDVRYKASYFEHFPHVWCHGDYVQRTSGGGYVIYGRSDAILNPGGVRIGTSEIYREVEKIPEVLESIVVGQAWDGDVRVVLFVTLMPGKALTQELADRIKSEIRKNTSPRHVPAKIVQVPDIPRTKSGKIMEIVVKKLIHGEPIKNREVISNPAALVYFQDIEALAN